MINNIAGRHDIVVVSSAFYCSMYNGWTQTAVLSFTVLDMCLVVTLWSVISPSLRIKWRLPTETRGVGSITCVCDIWMKSSQLLFDHRSPFLDVTVTKAVREAEAAWFIYTATPSCHVCHSVVTSWGNKLMDFPQFHPNPRRVLLPSLCAVHVLCLQHNSASLMSVILPFLTARTHKAAVGFISRIKAER